MAITLINTFPEDTIILSGGETFELSAGKRTQIRHNESGEIVDILDGVVPEGKKWAVSVSLHIVETYV